MVIIEAYAVVDSSSDIAREQFFAGLIEAIHQTRQEYPQTPLVLIGDLNGHIKGWYSETTNNNGRMIEHLANRLLLLTQLINDFIVFLYLLFLLNSLIFLYFPFF